jgi:hypothetical protein
MTEHQVLVRVAERSSNTADDRFIELLCADADLLRREFEAIIAANFDPPGTGQGRPRPPRREPIRSTGKLRPGGMRRPVQAVAGSPSVLPAVPEARERSPPAEGPDSGAQRGDRR